MLKFNIKLILLLYWIFNLNSIEIYSQIDSGYVEVKGGVLFYRIWGAGKPIVFLNGGPGLASNGYENYATEIEKNRKVILFDQRGTGKSVLENNPPAVYLSQMVKDIESLRKHLKIEKWDVFGHSFGGVYAINYIYKYPKSIDRVILSATQGVGKRSIEHFQYFKNPKPENLTSFEIQLFYAFHEELKKKYPDFKKLKRFSSAMKSRYYVSKPENYHKVADWWLIKANPISILLTVKNDNQDSTNKIIKKLRKFKNKMLIIHGIGDFINLSHPFLNHDIFPNSELKIIQDAGHVMSIDSKEEYFEIINEFLDKE